MIFQQSFLCIELVIVRNLINHFTLITRFKVFQRLATTINYCIAWTFLFTQGRSIVLMTLMNKINHLHSTLVLVVSFVFADYTSFVRLLNIDVFVLANCTSSLRYDVQKDLNMNNTHSCTVILFTYSQNCLFKNLAGGQEQFHMKVFMKKKSFRIRTILMCVLYNDEV